VPGVEEQMLRRSLRALTGWFMANWEWQLAVVEETPRKDGGNGGESDAAALSIFGRPARDWLQGCSDDGRSQNPPMTRLCVAPPGAIWWAPPPPNNRVRPTLPDGWTRDEAHASDASMYSRTKQPPPHTSA